MKKLLATLLALSLILGSLFTGMASISAATFTPVVNEETESYGLVPYPMDTYAAVANYKGYGNQLADYPYASIDKIGVDGTNGLKIEGEGKDIESYIRLGNGANFLDPATKYVLEFQVKSTVNLDETEEGYLEYGVFSAWKSDNREVYSFEEANVWETVSYTFVPSVNDSGVTGHCHVALLYNIPVGETLYFDNFALYTITETTDEGGNVTATVNRDINYFDRYLSGSRYKYYAIGANRGSFDWYEGGKVINGTATANTVPIEKSDIPLVNNETSAHPTNSQFDTMLTINAGDGVNGSAGMKIGYTNGKVVTPRFGLGVQAEQYGMGTNYFKVGDTYNLRFKAKKVGTVTDVAFEWKVSSPWCEHPIIAVDVTDEWVQYSVEIPMTSYDGNASGIIGHNNLTLKCKVAENSYLYIDDIEFGKESDSNRNVLDWGNFDKYTVSSVDNTALEGVTYEPYDFDVYNQGGIDTAVSDTFTTDFVNPYDLTLCPAASEVNITKTGVKDSYALELTGSGNERVISPCIGTYAMTYGDEFIVKFKMKVSDPAKLTMFNMGIRKRGAWKDDIDGTYFKMKSGANLSFGFMENSSEGLADVFSTEWQEYSFRIEPWIVTGNSYKYFYFDYTLAEGATIYIDDIELYKVGDGVNLYTKGNFERVSAVSAIDAGDEIGYYTSKYLNSSEGYYFDAKALPTSLAVSGKHVLAAGDLFGENTDSLSTGGRVGFELTGVAPGKTYKVAFSLIMIGDVTKLTASLSDHGAGAAKFLGESGIYSQSGFVAANAHNKHASSNWQNYEFIFTSEAETQGSWPAFEFYCYGNAGSGFLLEDVSVQEVLPDGSLAGNQFYCEGFEIPETSADYSSNKFWGTDVSDLSFMNDLPFAIDVMGLSSTKNPDIYEDVMKEDSDFAFANTVVISNNALDVIRYEAEVANNLGKEIWINADTFASKGGALSTGNWQALLTAASDIVQNIAGDNFQGFYFDEPHLHYASNDEFVTVTQFLRETFKKRVFAMNKHDSFNLEGDANVKMIAESHAYVTDVGYWNYTLPGIEDRVNGFNTAYARLNQDTRIWFACSLGSKPVYNEDVLDESSTSNEAEVIEIFNTMLAGVKDNDSFGGIMLYSTADTNGYNEIKLGEDGKAEYNTYRNILLSLSAELDGSVISVDGYAVNADGILTVSSAKTVADIIAAYNAVYTNVQVKDGEAVLEATDSINKTGLEIFVDSKMGKVLSTAIAYENDINGDADTNVLDLVRLKKIAGGLEATAAQIAAAGSTVAEGIDADNLTQYRQFLLGE